MNTDVVMVVVAVGMTVPILGASWGLNVVLLLPVHMGDGVTKRNGLWIVICKPCGWNDTHTSKYHGKWNQNQSTCNLLTTHVFRSKSGKTPSMEKGPASAPASASSGVSRGQLCGLINRYKTETEDGVVASFLNKFKGLLN
jgi:hypothetical protein